jgi:hypothetical protein
MPKAFSIGAEYGDIPRNLSSHSPPIQNEKIKISGLKKTFVLIYALALPCLCYYIGFYLTKEVDNLFNTQENFEIGSSVFEILITNEYSNYYPISDKIPTNQIVEPYRITYLNASIVSKAHSYRWLVDNWEIDNGSSISLIFPCSTTKRQFNISLERYSKGSIYVDTIYKLVTCKYVRREVRSLLAQDRVALFAAISVLQRVPTTTGQQLYGSRYFSKDHFNRLHLYFGGDILCDHLHEVIIIIIISTLCILHYIIYLLYDMI